MPLLAVSDYDQIRGALDPSLVGDTEALPDATIALPLYAPAAEAEVLRRVPNALALPDDAYAAAQRAAVYLTAARLAPVLPAITSETIGTYSYQRTTPEPRVQAAMLRGLAAREIAIAVGAAEDLAAAPTFFATAGARRGGWAWRR